MDTIVDVFGANTAFATNYYRNGYAFTAASEAVPIAAIGQYSDLMFGLTVAVPSYIVKHYFAADEKPNGMSSLFLYCEDIDMKVTDIRDGEANVRQEIEESYRDRPVFIDEGGKFEANYTDDETDNVSKIKFGFYYYHEPLDING